MDWNRFRNGLEQVGMNRNRLEWIVTSCNEIKLNGLKQVGNGFKQVGNGLKQVGMAWNRLGMDWNSLEWMETGWEWIGKG